MAKENWGKEITLRNVIIAYPFLYTKTLGSKEFPLLKPRYEAVFYLNNLEHKEESRKILQEIENLKKVNNIKDNPKLFYKIDHEILPEIEHLFDFGNGELPSNIIKIKASTEKEVLKIYNNEILDSKDDSEAILDLSLVNVIIKPFYYNEKGKGIKAYLQAVELVKQSTTPRTRPDYFQVFQDLKNSDNKHLEHYNNSVAALNFFE